MYVIIHIVGIPKTVLSVIYAGRMTALANQNIAEAGLSPPVSQSFNLNEYSVVLASSREFWLKILRCIIIGGGGGSGTTANQLTHGVQLL